MEVDNISIQARYPIEARSQLKARGSGHRFKKKLRAFIGRITAISIL